MMSALKDEYAGRLIITWPKSSGIATHGSLVTLIDAASGEQIVSTLDLDLTVHADPASIVTAEMTMLTNAEGKPLGRGEPVVYAEDGENLSTGRFRWLVTEMRIAE